MRIFLALCSLCTLWSAGCNVLGVAANAVGPLPVEAQYVPQLTPMLVLAENYHDPGATYIEAEQLEQFVAHELKSHEVAPLVGADRLADLRGSRPREFASMSVSSIGRAVGASQVLYIQMERTNVYVAQASEMLKGAAAARAKLIDVETGQTLWPADTPNGRFVSVETPMVRADESTSESAIRQSLQRALAEKIGKFFYKYKPD